MYDGVPMTMPALVRFDVSMRAIPRSRTLSAPPLVRMRFAGLTSRCTTPRSWAKSSASSNCEMIPTIWPRSKLALRLRYSRSPVPSTYSMAMNALTSSSPYSYTLTMFGCSSRPAALASFWKRAMTCAARSGSTRSLRTVLTATTRSMPGSNALYTTPIAPLPSTLWIVYLPILSGCSAIAYAPLARLRLQHLDRLHQTLVHPRQRLGQDADLVLALGLELAALELAEAHLVGELGQILDPLDHDRMQHHVDQDEGNDEHQRQQQHEHLERVVGALDRERARHRHDLGADDLVQLPAKAIGGPAELDHRLRRLVSRVGAGEAPRVCGADRAPPKQRTAHLPVGLPHQVPPPPGHAKRG